MFFTRYKLRAYIRDADAAEHILAKLLAHAHMAGDAGPSAYLAGTFKLLRF